MYLRRTQRRRKDGTVVGYLQLAHNHRVEGVTQAKVLLDLGREDELDVAGLRRLAGSIGRYLERSDGVGALEEATGGELRATDARPLGATRVWVALLLNLDTWEPYSLSGFAGVIRASPIEFQIYPSVWMSAKLQTLG
jgi:hypothetical protein